MSQPVPQASPGAGQANFTCGDWHLYQAGTAIYDDGRTGYEASCFQPMMDAAGNQPQNQKAPAENSNSEQCVGPAAVCGYGIGPNGKPNPSSGELQLLHGCQEGYVQDPARCAQVQDKANENGW
ncbi:hypothetical protein [Corynebacterium heidelbergense]|uniref:hypothetical protein n=1 Tax=Corynebacterium heidelbergense TaxID=2055947 RepID=UPI0010582476|nr:hypothetical protein [Corynebacterium heidelbergense]